MAEGDCYVGLIVGLVESRTYPYPGTDDEFSVNVRGRGRFLDRLAGIRIRINNETIDGRVYDFEASHQDDGVWRIDRVAGSTEPPSADDVDGDGIPNVSDHDDDNDGTPDTDDPCPLDGRDTCDDASGVASLEVSGMMPLTSIGETIELAATAHRLDGSSQAIASAFVHWVSADPAVASVVDGTVTAVGGGNVRIVATHQGQKAVAEVAVYISVRDTGTVRMIYAAPADREFRSDYRNALRHATVDLQSWYRQQLGGLTFSIYDTMPEQCRMSENADYFDQSPWPKVLEAVQHCAPVRGNTDTFAWVVYADLDELCDQQDSLGHDSLGRGGRGLTINHGGSLEGLIGKRLTYYTPCGRGPFNGPVTRWIGGSGHELGHVFGLAHPPGCDDGLPSCDSDALMYLGHLIYPNTYLRPDDKQVLWRSPFIDKDPAERQLTGDAGKVTALRGTVTDPDGDVIAGIRIAAAGDDFWAWGESALDGSYEIRLPKGSAGSAVLSVQAGDAADCGWLGYHVAGGLTTIQPHATSVEVGAVEPTDVDIILPVDAGDLCQGQRKFSGIVRGPEGNPADVWTYAFGQWIRTGDDGRFEIRLPESESVAGSTSRLRIHARECSDTVGFYGTDSFTTNPANAWTMEFGGVDVTGIEITLPAMPQELCDRQPIIAGTLFGPDGVGVEGIRIEAQPFRRGRTTGADGSFEIRMLEGTTGSAVLAINADCGIVGYYGPDGFTTSRDDATGVDVGEGNLTGIEIRLPSSVDELCGQ